MSALRGHQTLQLLVGKGRTAASLGFVDKEKGGRASFDLIRLSPDHNILSCGVAFSPKVAVDADGSSPGSPASASGEGRESASPPCNDSSGWGKRARSSSPATSSASSSPEPTSPFVICPICSRAIPSDNGAQNAHLDRCLLEQPGAPVRAKKKGATKQATLPSFGTWQTPAPKRKRPVSDSGAVLPKSPLGPCTLSPLSGLQDDITPSRKSPIWISGASTSGRESGNGEAQAMVDREPSGNALFDNHDPLVEGGEKCDAAGKKEKSRAEQENGLSIRPVYNDSFDSISLGCSNEFTWPEVADKPANAVTQAPLQTPRPTTTVFNRANRDFTMCGVGASEQQAKLTPLPSEYSSERASHAQAAFPRTECTQVIEAGAAPTVSKRCSCACHERSNLDPATTLGCNTPSSPPFGRPDSKEDLLKGMVHSRYKSCSMDICVAMDLREDSISEALDTFPNHLCVRAKLQEMVPFNTVIVGRRFHRDAPCEEGMRVELLREPGNVKDSNAIQVVSTGRDGPACVLGHIPRTIAHHMAKLLDGGFCLTVMGTVLNTPSRPTEPAQVRLVCHLSSPKAESDPHVMSEDSDLSKQQRTKEERHGEDVEVVKPLLSPHTCTSEILLPEEISLELALKHEQQEEVKSEVHEESDVDVVAFSYWQLALKAAAAKAGVDGTRQLAGSTDAAGEGKRTRGGYQANFLYMLDTVLERDGHLFDEDETRLLSSFKKLPEDAQRLFLRIVQRKGPWFRVGSLNYSDVDDKALAVDSLLGASFVCGEHDGGGPLPLEVAVELLGVLRVWELKELLYFIHGKGPKKRGSEQVSGRREDLLARAESALREEASPLQQGLQITTSAVASEREALAESELIAELLRLCGPLIRIAPAAGDLVFRLQRVFFLNSEQELSVFLLADMGTRRYPIYRCWRTGPVFESRTSLLQYLQAVDLAQAMNTAVESGNIDQAFYILKLAREWLAREPRGPYVAALTESQQPGRGTSASVWHGQLEGGAEPEPDPNGVTKQASELPFKARFTAGWALTAIGTLGVSVLERERRYSEAVDTLRLLLASGWSRNRRGYWTVRLSIDLDHLGRKEESLCCAEAGVGDPWIIGGDRLALQRRVVRLARPPRRWKKPPYAAVVEQECREVRILGRPLNRLTGERSRFYGFDGEQCSVEELALQHYA
eukprot:TRINITY_DN21055_c0_g1_i1.p1 TRINITY_DN21055_c0_g1~~TRINITY_DN21055_c0_g1_i1.p1  ORF type:complete len:1170 (-),score=184.47 TRINITY_DN21055_c0_g1_i1:4-3513(-)